MSLRPLRPLVLLALLITVPACVTWRPYAPASTDAELPERIRLQLETGETVTMQPLSLEGDTVWVGVVDSERMARVPVREVRGVEEGRPPHPLVVVLGIGAITAAVVLAAAADGLGSPRR